MTDFEQSFAQPELVARNHPLLPYDGMASHGANQLVQHAPYDPRQAYELGKTTLLAQWHHALAEKGLAIPPHAQLEDLARQVGPREILLAFSSEHKLLWEQPLERTIPNLIGDWASHRYAEAVRKDSNLSDMENAVIGNLFDRLGLAQAEMSDIIRSWESLDYQTLIGDNRTLLNEVSAQSDAVLHIENTWQENFRNMFTLEKLHPGSVRTLYNECGIRNFGRYNHTDLLAQLVYLYGTSTQPSKISMVLSAADDTNGGLEARQYKGLKRLVDDGMVIFAEARNGGEAMRRFVRIARKLGLPIDRIIIATHATEHELGSVSGQVLTQEEIANAGGIARLKAERLLGKQAVAMIYACRAGAEGGIATTFAKRAGIPTYAFVHDLYGINVARSDMDRDGLVRFWPQPDGTPNKLVLIQPDGTRSISNVPL